MIKQLKTFKCPDISSKHPDQQVFNIKKVTASEVKSILSLKNSKAKDIYGLDTNLLKSNKEVLINLSIKECCVPTSWKITPVFKAGDKTKPENYRPIRICQLSQRWQKNGY